MAKARHKKKKKISFSKIIALLLLVSSVLLSVEVIAIDIIPSKYIAIFIGIMIFINFIVDISVFRKTGKKGLKRFMTGIAVIFIFLFTAAFIYLVKTMGFLNNIKGSEYKIENYSVVVRKSSKYKKLSDIKGQTVGYYDKTTGATKANKKLGSKVDVKFDSYDDSTAMAKKLLKIEEEENNSNDEDLEVIVVEDSILSMIKEEISEFESDTRVIYKFKIMLKVSDNAKDVNVTNKAFNIYISGIDTFGEISSVSRSDVNMVVTVNPKTKQILLTSIPRDYYVKLHTYKEYDKLTHAGMYGVDESIKTIEDLLDIDINYYVKVNFTSVVDIVNALGGLTVYSDYDFVSEDGFRYSKGNNKMNGEEALSFARERHSFADGDRQRVKDQQAVFSAMIKKACSKSILTKYSSLLNSLEGKFETNLSSRKIKALVKMQLNDMAKWTVTSISLEGFDSHNSTYSAGSQQLYVMNPDEGSVKDASKLIKSVMKGKKLKGTYELETSGTSNVTNTKTTNSKTSNNNSSSMSATASCQSGYTLSKDQTVCTRTESIEPTDTCSNGQQAKGGYCYTVVATPTCDPNNADLVPCEPCSEGTYEDGKCVKKTSSNPTCSNGYKLNGSSCTKVSTVYPSYSCPSGYRLSGKSCVK